MWFPFCWGENDKGPAPSGAEPERSLCGLIPTPLVAGQGRALVPPQSSTIPQSAILLNLEDTAARECPRGESWASFGPYLHGRGRRRESARYAESSAFSSFGTVQRSDFTGTAGSSLCTVLYQLLAATIAECTS